MSDRVIVVGAGPTGLMLSIELALAGVACTILEKRAEQSNITRAFTNAPRTLELLDARGMADEVIAKGHKAPKVWTSTGVGMDFSVIKSRFPFMLMAKQSITEHVLESRCVELGVEIVRGAEVTGIAQDPDGVTVTINGSRTDRAAYVVGCDGAHSAVRRELGTEFVGGKTETRIVLCDVRLVGLPADALRISINSFGMTLVVPFGEGLHRVVIWDLQNDDVPMDKPITLEEMKDAAKRIAGTDYGMHDVQWQSRFLSQQRQAVHYRNGRVLLAGDAAHTHSPIGGQGMNTGIGDALNLGWKLAAQVKGTAPAWLLDSYEAERHPIGTLVLKMTTGLTRAVLIKSKVQLAVIQFLMRNVLSIEAVRRIPRGLVTGIDLKYTGRGAKPHKLAGKRAQDVDLDGDRLYEVLRDAHFVLIDRSGAGGAARRAKLGWADRVTVRTAAAAGGRPAVMLVRPDAYVAWASDAAPSDSEIESVLADWCGPALRAARAGA